MNVRIVWPSQNFCWTLDAISTKWIGTEKLPSASPRCHDLLMMFKLNPFQKLSPRCFVSVPKSSLKIAFPLNTNKFRPLSCQMFNFTSPNVSSVVGFPITLMWHCYNVPCVEATRNYKKLQVDAKPAFIFCLYRAAYGHILL